MTDVSSPGQLIQMVEHTIDSKTNEYGLGTTEAELSIHDKQLSVPVKKTVLRDVQNDNRIAAPNSVGSSSPSKDRIPNSNSPRVSGTKRPLSECQMIPPEHQLSSSSSGNGHLVYVRRKSEADVVRSSTNDNANINADCQVSKKLSNQQASTGPISQTKEPKVHRANDNETISTDCEVSRIINHHEAGTGPISQTKEPKVHCSNDNESISADCEVSRIISHQEAGAGPISQPKEPEVHVTNDNASISADCEVSRIISNKEAGTGPISQTQEPKVHFANDNASINTDCQVSRIISQQEASTGPIFQNKEPMIHCIPAFAPLPMETAAIPPGKPSVSLPHCKSDIRVAPAGSNCQSLASAAPSLGSSKGLRNLHWEERFHQLQLLLRKLDQSEHEDYIKCMS